MSNSRLSILQSKAVKDRRVSDAQLRTLAALGCYGDEDGWCFPRLKVLGEDLGKSPQAVSKDIKALVKYGYIEKKARFRENGSQRSNLYRLKFDLPPSTSEVYPPSTSEVEHNEEEGEESQEFKDAWVFYQNNINPAPTEYEASRFIELCDEHNPNWVVEAAKAAVERGARNIKYISAILKRWKVDGYGTPHPKQKRKEEKEKAEEYPTL